MPRNGGRVTKAAARQQIAGIVNMHIHPVAPQTAYQPSATVHG
jgi:hypothetical protein